MEWIGGLEGLVSVGRGGGNALILAEEEEENWRLSHALGTLSLRGAKGGEGVAKVLVLSGARSCERHELWFEFHRREYCS